MVDDGVKAALAAMRARWNEGAARDADPGDRFASFCDVPKLLAVAEAAVEMMAASAEHKRVASLTMPLAAVYNARDESVAAQVRFCAALAALGEP